MPNVPATRAWLDPDEIIVDSFAGGGGASQGITEALGRAPDIAINHDAEAIALHKANHPTTEHFPENVWKVDPVTVCRGRRVGLMWLSPDCKHFSKAKGGKPVEKKVRGLAWVAVRWAKAVRPRVIVLENVEEFQHWGPLFRSDHPNRKLRDRPDPERKALTFRRFVGRLRALGYVVEWRELRACDYGAPTTRKRLFLVARCDGQPIHWPEATHGKHRLLPWRTAAECIDWSIPCPSIFLTPVEAKSLGVRRPLADATLRRIARGVQRYVIDAADPFIVSYYGAKRDGDDRTAPLDGPLPTQTTENRFAVVDPFIVPVSHSGDDRTHSVHDPLRTITGGSRGTHAIVQPFIAGVGGRMGQSAERGVDRPYQTITAKADAALVVPTLIQTSYGEDKKRNGGMGQPPRVLDLGAPLGTVVAGGIKHSLVSAFLAKHYGGHETPGSSLAQPIDTVTGTDHHAVVSAHIAKHYGGRVGSSMDEPLHTVTADSVHHSVVASSLVKLKGTAKDGQQLSLPLHTVQAGGNHYGEVRAFLMKYHATGGQWNALSAPMPTAVAKDSIALVTVAGAQYVIADIGMRMLAPRELYHAQGFPSTYRIDIEFNGKPLSKTAQVKMCGNSVCPPLAAAIVRANFATTDRQEVAA
jgi:DNA (cytosine-5)-methyltransferase 1